MAGQDVVYANLSGQMEEQAKNIVKAMNADGVKRLIFISSMGIYGEVPGERYRSILDPYRDSARVIEGSTLDYGTTQKGEAFKNASWVVSRKSIADLVVKLATTPTLESRRSLGVHKV